MTNLLLAFIIASISTFIFATMLAWKVKHIKIKTIILYLLTAFLLEQVVRF